MKKFMFVLIAALAAQSSACTDPNHTEVTTDVYWNGQYFGVWPCGDLTEQNCTHNYQCGVAFNETERRLLGGEFSCVAIDQASNACGRPINICVRQCSRTTVLDDYGNPVQVNDTCGDGYQCNMRTHICDFKCNDGVCMPFETNVCGTSADCAYCNDGFCSGDEERFTCGEYDDCRPDQTPHNVPPCGNPNNTCDPDPQPVDKTMVVTGCWPKSGIAAFEAAGPLSDWKAFGAISWRNSDPWGSGQAGHGLEIDSAGCFTVTATDVDQGFHMDLMKCEDEVGCWGSTLYTQPMGCSVDGKPGTIGAYEEGLGWPCLTQSGGVWKP